jgi:hypothetical protein
MSDRVKLLEPEVVDEASAARDLEHLLAQPVDQRQSTPFVERIDGIVIGTLVAFVDPNQPLVVYPGQQGTAPLVARSSFDLRAEHVGHEVTLMFENGDPQKPIVIGRIRVPSAWPLTELPTHVEVETDGRRLTITAEDQLVLRCGEASITLHRSGKVVIRGQHIVSHATGVNRVRGGSVHLN